MLKKKTMNLLVKKYDIYFQLKSQKIILNLSYQKKSHKTLSSVRFQFIYSKKAIINQI